MAIIRELVSKITHFIIDGHIDKTVNIKRTLDDLVFSDAANANVTLSDLVGGGGGSTSTFVLPIDIKNSLGVKRYNISEDASHNLIFKAYDITGATLSPIVSLLIPFDAT